MSVDAEQYAPRIPKPGDRINIHDAEEIWEAIQIRQKNFTDEPEVISFATVIFNIGDRYAPVSCVAGEWSGLKRDVHKPHDKTELPKCPNGHVLTQGSGLQLGWIEGD